MLEAVGVAADREVAGGGRGDELLDLGVDGLQAGLAVAEALGCVRRPWDVANESGRIHLDEREPGLQEAEAA